MRPRAGVDLDGVVHDWEANTRRIIQERFGISITLSPHYNWIKEECARQGRPDAWTWLWSAGPGVPEMFSGDMYPDARVHFHRLAETHDIVIVTKRPRAAIPVTLYWLWSHVINPSELVILHDDLRGKSTVECDWYVDDSPEIVEELWRAGKRVYVMNRPWNEKLPAEVEAGVTRVNDWNELMERVG